MIPVFPLSHPPTCLGSTCQRLCTDGITQSNHNGNRGRPYYTCKNHRPGNKFSCFDDAIGISPANPRCNCQYYSRRTRDFYSCPVGSCGWTQDADTGFADGSSWSTAGSYNGNTAAMYGTGSYNASTPPPRYDDGVTSVASSSGHYGVATIASVPPLYVFGTNAPNPTQSPSSLAPLTRVPPLVHRPNQNAPPPNPNWWATIPEAPPWVHLSSQNAPTLIGAVEVQDRRAEGPAVVPSPPQIVHYQGPSAPTPIASTAGQDRQRVGIAVASSPIPTVHLPNQSASTITVPVIPVPPQTVHVPSQIAPTTTVPITSRDRYGMPANRQAASCPPMYDEWDSDSDMERRGCCRCAIM